jgi:hypothetical protein
MRSFGRREGNGQEYGTGDVNRSPPHIEMIVDR